MRLTIKMITIVFILICIIFIQSCECPLQEANLYSNCKVREATITMFNPKGTIQQVTNPDGTSDLVFVPDSLYSIHTFLFPFEENMSGLLINDERFAKSSTIPIVKIPFSDGRPYYVSIFDNYPQNNDMNGDILLYYVADDFSYAEIRVAGDLVRINQNFNSENSSDFCDFINNFTRDTAEMARLKSDLKKFGLDARNTFNFAQNYTYVNIVVLDINNNIVTNVTPLQADIDQALQKTTNKSVNIRVRIGEVYLYRARNGKYFIFAITDIRQGTLNPYKRRLTIMFSEVN